MPPADGDVIVPRIDPAVLDEATCADQIDAVCIRRSGWSADCDILEGKVIIISFHRDMHLR